MSGAIAFASAAAAAGGRSEIIAGPALVFDLADVTATAGVTFRPDGSYQSITGSIPSGLGDWVRPAEAADEWEIRATRASGATPTSGALNTWLALTSARSWFLTRTSPGFFEMNLTFEFRRAGSTDPEVTIGGNIFQVEVIF